MHNLPCKPRLHAGIIRFTCTLQVLHGLIEKSPCKLVYMGGIFHYKSPWKFGLHGVTSFPPCKHAATHLLGCFANTPCRPYLHGAVMLHTYIRADIHAYLLICILTCLLTYIHTYLHTYILTYLHTYILTHLHTYKCMHTSTHAHMRAYKHIH